MVLVGQVGHGRDGPGQAGHLDWPVAVGAMTSWRLGVMGPRVDSHCPCPTPGPPWSDQRADLNTSSSPVTQLRYGAPSRLAVTPHQPDVVPAQTVHQGRLHPSRARRKALPKVDAVALSEHDLPRWGVM